MRFDDRIDAFFDGGQHNRSILALAHQHHAVDDVVVAVLARHSLPRHAADGHLRDVFDKNRGAVELRYRYILDILGRTQQTNTANQKLLTSLLDIATAGIGV